MPAAIPAFADIPRAYRLPVVSALIRVEEMRVALYEENEAGHAGAEWRASECRERLEQLRELKSVMLEFRAAVAAHTTR